MTIYNIRDYALPDALPKPKRGKAALAGMVGVAVGLVLGLALGVGVGANFALVSAFRATHTIAVAPVLSARERFRQCGMTEADPVPTPEKLEAMLVRWRARYAEPKWGAP
jgi:hypothetical protein